MDGRPQGVEWSGRPEPSTTNPRFAPIGVTVLPFDFTVLLKHASIDNKKVHVVVHPFFFVDWTMGVTV
jgi:hypothetical protein